MERGFGAWSGVGFGRCATGARRLLNDGEFVLPFFQEGVRLEGEGFVGGGELPTVQRNGVGLEGVAGVGLGGAETRGDEGVEERVDFSTTGRKVAKEAKSSEVRAEKSADLSKRRVESFSTAEAAAEP